jgi:hypothetical protein
MVLRIKSRWHNSGRHITLSKAVDEHASALAFIIWRLSLDGARDLHGEGYEYLSDYERIGVITEFVAYMVQLTDRLAHGQLADTARDVLLNALAHRLADQMQDNLTDIAGPGNYRAPFIKALNARLTSYSSTSFDAKTGAGFDGLRLFGARILEIMGETQTNRWVIDQIMQIDGPDLFDKLRPAFANLLGSAETLALATDTSG